MLTILAVSNDRCQGRDESNEAPEQVGQRALEDAAAIFGVRKGVSIVPLLAKLLPKLVDAGRRLLISGPKKGRGLRPITAGAITGFAEGECAS